jgi:hypothetical protein
MTKNTEYISELQLSNAEAVAAMNLEHPDGWQPWRVDASNVQWFSRESQTIYGVPAESADMIRGSDDDEDGECEFYEADDDADMPSSSRVAGATRWEAPVSPEENRPSGVETTTDNHGRWWEAITRFLR